MIGWWGPLFFHGKKLRRGYIKLTQSGTQLLLIKIELMIQIYTEIQLISWCFLGKYWEAQFFLHHGKRMKKEIIIMNLNMNIILFIVENIVLGMRKSKRRKKDVKSF